MSLANSMKSLVDGINASIKERGTFVKDVVEDVHALKKETKDLIARYQKELENLRVDLKANAKNLHSFLASSEKGRKDDFKALMAEIHKGLKEITKWQGDVRADTRALLKETRTMMKEYSDDIQQARVHWQSIQHGEGKKSGTSDHLIKKKARKHTKETGEEK